MKQRKPMMYGVGIACCVLLLTAAAAVSPTQARYENVDSWKGVYAPVLQKVTSNYLAAQGQTVLLQPWEITEGSTRVEEIMLTANTGAVTGTLQCSTDSPYILAQVEQVPVQVGQGGYITTLRLTAADTVDQLDRQTQAAVTVTFTDQSQTMELKADFRVMLIPQPEESETQPEESETQPEESETQPEEPEIQPEELQTQSDTETEPQAAVSYVEVQQSEEQLVFAWQEKLVFSMSVQGSADTLELMYDGDNFPEGTRYCAGKEIFVLGDPMTIKLPVTDANIALWLDFSQTEETAPQAFSITANAYFEDVITGETSFTVPVSRVALALNPGVKPVIADKGILSVPMSGDDIDLSWKIEHLSFTDTGIAWQEGDFGLAVQILRTEREDGTVQQTLEISNAEGLAPAGTYRLILTRQDTAEIVGTCQLDFFIHY